MQDEHDTPLPTKEELLERVQHAWDELEQTLAHLSEEQQTTPPPGQTWSIKDHLAHLAAWKAGIIALLHHQPRWQAMGLPIATLAGTDGDAINEQIYQQNRARSLADVTKDFRQTQQRMLDTLAGMSDDDLVNPYSLYGADEPGDERDEPVVGWIIGNTYEHDAEHTQWIEEHLGQ